MVTRRDYTQDAVEAARSVLLEVVRLLGEYSDDIVIIGGWVPELVIPQAKHVGSMDIDLALNHRTLTESGYKTILELLQSRGYRQGKQPFIFHRTVRVGNREIRVQVDFLAGEYGGTGRSRRTQRVLDMRPRKARGVDLAFDAPTYVTIHGHLPNGGDDRVVVQVASIPVFLVMKGMSMKNRLKEKDAWDVYFCLRNYPGGMDVLVREFQSLLGMRLVREGLRNIAEKFSSPQAVGPVHVANFEELSDPQAREILQRDAFERVQFLLSKLGVK